MSFRSPDLPVLIRIDSTRTARTLTSKLCVARTRISSIRPLSVPSQTSSKPPAVLTRSQKDLQTSSTSRPAPVETRQKKQKLPRTLSTGISMSKPSSVKRMIHYFYHHDYQEHRTTLRNGAEMPESLSDVHSRLYAMGEKYGIPGLKAVALQKFGCVSGKIVRTPSMIRATVIAFNSTPESDKSLRMEVLRVLHDSRRIWKDRTPVHTMILSMPEVGYGLYLRSIEQDLL
jgi:hypothetical protein